MTDDTGARLDAEYVLPLRRDDADPAGLGELTGYLSGLARRIDVTVVDGSAAAGFARHRRAWEPLIRAAGLRHLAPDPAACRGEVLNGKVCGVVTGVRAARHRRVVVADDDVRYDPGTLAALLARLDGVQLVRPQNVLDPTAWHARWDTGRTLLNRAFGADHPGTFALDRDAFVAMGGYAADVLFENLELVRTVRAAGGTVRDAPDLVVRRLPPTTAGFLEQRRRQAYDSLAEPGRLAVELALLPTGLAIARRRPWGLGLAALGVTALAEVGRRRHGGAAAFAPTAALWAPLWVAERSVCAWLALAERGRGGMPYRGRRIRVAAHSQRRLRAQPARRPGEADRPGDQPLGRNTLRMLSSFLCLNMS